MSDRMGKARGHEVTFVQDYAAPRAPREPTPEEKAAGARTIANNFDGQLELVRDSVAKMKTAAVAADRDAWTAAERIADLALTQLVQIARVAPTAARDAMDGDVRKRLESAGQVLDEVQQLVAGAPAAPAPRVPTLTCVDALRAALPPDHPVSPAEPVYAPAEIAVARIFREQFTTSDIAAFRAILDVHPDHDIARRFQRFGIERRARLLGLFDRSQVKAQAREREALRRTGVAEGGSKPQSASAPPEHAAPSAAAPPDHAASAGRAAPPALASAPFTVPVGGAAPSAPAPTGDAATPAPVSGSTAAPPDRAAAPAPMPPDHAPPAGDAATPATAAAPPDHATPAGHAASLAPAPAATPDHRASPPAPAAAPPDHAAPAGHAAAPVPAPPHAPAPPGRPAFPVPTPPRAAPPPGGAAPGPRPRLLVPEPGPRPASTIRIPDADHPTLVDLDGQQVMQIDERSEPGNATPFRGGSWKVLTELADSLEIRDDTGDTLHVDITYRLESRPAEVGEIPETWIHTERTALLTVASGEHARATIVGQARIHLAPGEPLDPKAAIVRGSIGPDHRGQVYLADAGQYVTLHGPGGQASLMADAAREDVLAYDLLRQLVGLRNILKQQHVAGRGGQVAAMHDRAQRLLAGAERGRAILEHEMAAIASSHDPHPTRVEAVRILVGNIAAWLDANRQAERQHTEDARLLTKAHAELAQLLADLERVHAPQRNHLDDALGAPVRLLERTGQGIGELAATLVDAVALDANAIGAATGLGTFDYRPSSQLFRAVEATGSSTTALVRVVNGFANEWSDAIERARNGDYRGLTDVSIDTLLMIDGARAAGPVALAHAEALASNLGTIATSARVVAASAVDSAGLLVARARSIAAAMGDAADVFAAQLRGGMPMATAGAGGVGPMVGGLSADTLIEAARAAKQAFQGRRSAPLEMRSREPGDPGSLFDSYGPDSNYWDERSTSDTSRDSGLGDEHGHGDEIDEIGTAEPEKDGTLADRRIRHVPLRRMDPGVAAERGMGELHANRLGIARPPRHHLLPQEEIAFFQERGFPGRDIDNFCVEFLDPLDHELVHGGKQALARKHWQAREWTTAFMGALREEEVFVGRKLNRQDIFRVLQRQRVAFGIADRPFIRYRSGR